MEQKVFFFLCVFVATRNNTTVIWRGGASAAVSTAVRTTKPIGVTDRPPPIGHTHRWEIRQGELVLTGKIEEPEV